METGSESRAIVQLLSALQENQVKFMLVGMTAANLQGVMQGTIDVDVWVGLPARQYMRVMNLCHSLGATLRGQNKVYLSDETPVDFIYEVTGVDSFEREYRRAVWVPFHGLRVPVMPLDKICKSKEASGRDKDKLHILLIKQALRVQKAATSKTASKRKQVKSRKASATARKKKSAR